jgi:hypothetical protein
MRDDVQRTQREQLRPIDWPSNAERRPALYHVPEGRPAAAGPAPGRRMFDAVLEWAAKDRTRKLRVRLAAVDGTGMESRRVSRYDAKRRSTGDVEAPQRSIWLPRRRPDQITEFTGNSNRLAHDAKTMASVVGRKCSIHKRTILEIPPLNGPAEIIGRLPRPSGRATRSRRG